MGEHFAVYQQIYAALILGLAGLGGYGIARWNKRKENEEKAKIAAFVILTKIDLLITYYVSLANLIGKYKSELSNAKPNETNLLEIQKHLSLDAKEAKGLLDWDSALVSNLGFYKTELRSVFDFFGANQVILNRFLNIKLDPTHFNKKNNSINNIYFMAVFIKGKLALKTLSKIVGGHDWAEFKDSYKLTIKNLGLEQDKDFLKDIP